MKQYRVRRWIRNWLTNFDANQSLQTSKISVRESDEPDTEKCLNFRVWFANGGKVIQTNRYDRQKDRSVTSMYVVTNELDFGNEVNKIITMESLRG